MGQLCRACATFVLFHSGQWDGALALSAEVVGEARATPHARAVATGVAGLVHALRGETVLARASLLESRTTARRIDLVAMELLSTWGLALLDEAAQHYSRAAESYRHVVARCRETEERHYCVPILQYAAARFAQDGAPADLGAATALLAEAVAATGQPEARAAFAYAVGQSALAAGDRVAALNHFRQAIDLFDGLDLPVADALTRLATAGLQRDGDLLQQAGRTAHRLKARLLIDRIGAPAEPRTLLTPRETEVLKLVGEGLTNREIGQRLFLSVRTVEMHARNAMRKLGSRTRAEAAATAARMD